MRCTAAGVPSDTQARRTSSPSRRDDFRGESRFTTWAYSFAVHATLIASRRERWGRVSLDRLLERPDLASRIGAAGPDPERTALQQEMLGAIREAITLHLTPRQQQALTADTKRYRTTPLRALWQHPPYVHDGRAADLSAVLTHYEQIFSLNLSKKDKADLVEFLKSL